MLPDEVEGLSGNTSQFIFTPEEQIEYASNILSIKTADVFSFGGVGQGTNPGFPGWLPN
jgi:2-keto-4-pentenoate hydratase/2-oxohepta-3-ene-1,7-dioic acid hydratase in catechol pathway